MKKRIVATCASFVLSFGLAAAAQQPKTEQAAPAMVVANGTEDRAFKAFKAETNIEKQAAAGLEFEKSFPKSPFLPNLHAILVTVFLQKNDTRRMIEFGEKAYKEDPHNVGALLALSRGHALSEERNVEKAQEFARLAVAVLEELRSKPPQGGLTDKQWKDWLKQNEDSVTPWVEYVKLLQPPAKPEPPATPEPSPVAPVTD